ncbi:hypothetical protein GXB85_13660 [Cellulomonas sp. APG4]|uniref:helix-turn-helix domain-containing protein n=1 Tax=Cellulomonas sp. APG4 TaxID=1538656 RepID=UPI00137B035B|nr:helix-turn-helix domain-containing protein [Cellulomonas sp. APG4]NCT91989.1 hypothetical protein [Cellulomonas sp. APG4]
MGTASAQALARRLETLASERGKTVDELVTDLDAHFDGIVDRLYAHEIREDLLGRLHRATEAKAQADAAHRHLMIRAGLAGIPRTEIARAAGCTRQWVVRVLKAHTARRDAA